MQAEALTDSSIFDLNQGIVPVFGGFGLLIWMVWRLFWKVDRRLQQELAAKDKKIIELTAQLESEKTLRYAAQEERSKSKAEQETMASQIQQLTEQVRMLTQKITSLEQQLQGGTAT